MMRFPDYQSALKITKSKAVIHSFHPIYDIFKEGGLDIFKFKKKFKLKKKVLLFFGFIRPYKGLEYLIEAINTLKKEYPDLSLIIAGELFWKSKSKPKTLMQKLKSLPFRMLKVLTIRGSKVEVYNPFKLINKFSLKE